MEVHKVGYMEVRIQCRDQIRVLALRLTTGKKKTLFDKWVPPGAQANKCLEHISKRSISNGTLDNTANSSNQHKYFEPHNQSSTVNIGCSPPRSLCWRPEIARLKNSCDTWRQFLMNLLIRATFVPTPESILWPAASPEILLKRSCYSIVETSKKCKSFKWKRSQRKARVKNAKSKDLKRVIFWLDRWNKRENKARSMCKGTKLWYHCSSSELCFWTMAMKTFWNADQWTPELPRAQPVSTPVAE